MGTQIDDPVLLPLAPVEQTESGLRGEVIHIDHFGNLATNIRDSDLAGLGQVSVDVCGITINGLVKTFGERPPGELVVLINSVGELGVAVTNGNAQARLSAKVGDRINVNRIA
jgi:hypothetical protein